MLPRRFLLSIVVVVFAVEATVHFLLAETFPHGPWSLVESGIDAFLMTTVSSAVVWSAIVRPLRRTAQAEQSRAEALLAASAEGVIAIDGRGVIQSFNPAAERIFGYSAKEVVGGSVSRLMPGELVAAHEKGLNACLASGEAYLPGRVIEFTGRRKDGQEVPLALSVVSVLFQTHRLVTGVVRDLTAARLAQAERECRARQQAVVLELGQRALAQADLAQLLRTAAKSVVETLGVDFCLVWELHPDGKTLALRAGAGIPEDAGATVPWDGAVEPVAMVGRDAASDAPQASHFGCASFLRALGAAGGAGVVIRGSDRPFGVLGAYTAQPRVFGKDEIHFLQDVAMVITLAAQRRLAELRQRERDLLRAEQMAAVAQIATGVAHELRNPLTSVKMLVQANRERAEAAAQDGEDLRVIEEEIRRMERCLQAFLDFARPPKPDRRAVDLATLVDRTFVLAAPRAARQGVRLEFTPPSTPVVLDADPGQIQQILLNLALNALDAMPRGGKAIVEVAELADGRAELRVLDTGPGLAPEVLSQLFRPFVTGKETGAGLGLVISQRIAENHGGSLSACNRPSGGACFVLRLPLRCPTEAR